MSSSTPSLPPAGVGAPASAVPKPPALGAPAIYVLWHPAFVQGPRLARSVFDWIRKHNNAHSIRGSETPVYYRSTPWMKHLDLPGKELLEDQRPIGLAQPSSNEPKLLFPCRPYNLTDASGLIVVALVDDHMICSEDWRRHLYALAARHWETRKWLDTAGRRRAKKPTNDLLLVPVELSSGYPQLHQVLSGINPVRVDHRRDDCSDPNAQLERRAERLRRHLTQVLVRHYRELDHRDQRVDHAELRLPRAVFLSHATSDEDNGVGVAEAIQREALNLGQVDTFLNTTTLDWGKGWEDKMIEAAGEDAAALVAIMGDNYASRPWCRREIQAARRLRKFKLAAKSKPYKIWRSQPVVLVDTLASQWTRLLPEFSGLPIVRWRDDSDSGQVLDRLMLEALQTLVHARYILELAPDVQSTRDLHFLAVSPDPYTLMEWQAQAQEDEKAEPANPDKTVVYPGHRMLPEDEQRLGKWFGDRVRFVSLDDAVDAVSRGQPLDSVPNTTAFSDSQRRLTAALATGDIPPNELAALGIGTEHVHEAIFRWARALLMERVAIAHTGSFDFINEILQPLLDTVEDAEAKPARKLPPEKLACNRAARLPWVQAYVGWTESRCTDVAFEARRLNRCRVRRFDAAYTQEPLRRAESLSKMREEIIKDSDFALIVGGDLAAYSGWAPGVIEVAAHCIAAGKLAIPLAMFGGASRQLLRWLLRSDKLPADADDWVASWRAGMREDLSMLIKNNVSAAQHYDDRRIAISTALTQWREQFDAARTSNYHGIPWETAETLMTTDSVRMVRRHLRWSVLPAIGAA